MKHYSLVELDMYRDGHMSVLGRINCGAHLQSCPKCAARMKKLEEDDKFLEQLRDSIQTFEALRKEEEERNHINSEGKKKNKKDEIKKEFIK